MNITTHPDDSVCSGGRPTAVDCNANARPPWWVHLLPVLPVIPGLVITELGLHRIPVELASASEMDPAAIWMLQSLITGILAIFLLAAWGYSLCRLRWPNDPSGRLKLGITVPWTCIGWTLWMAIRANCISHEDMIMLILMVSLPALFISIPLLWHAILKLQQPCRSAWAIAGFLGGAICLQCWGTARVTDDPLYIFILNSALIAMAVALWLVVISLPSTKTSVPQIP
jgi:hypothetical protein